MLLFEITGLLILFVKTNFAFTDSNKFFDQTTLLVDRFLRGYTRK